MSTYIQNRLLGNNKIYFNLFESELFKPLLHERAYRKLDCHLLVGFFSANCETQIDYRSYQGNDCSFHIIPARTPFVIEANKKDTGFLLFLKKDYLHTEIFQFIEGNAIQLFAKPSCLQLDENRTAGLMQTIIEMAIHCQSISHLEGCTSFLLNYLLIENQRNAEIEPEIICKAENLIASHYKVYRKADDYAHLLNIEIGNLNRKLMTWRNKTVTNLIHEALLTEMKRQLASTNNEIKQIAYDLHFEECSHFTRFFKHHTSMTPSIFRKRVRFGNYQ